jgi:hypothetical protein
MLSEVVGLVFAVLTTIPVCVTMAPPLVTMVPPIVVPEEVVFVGPVVVMTGTVGVDDSLLFLQESSIIVIAIKIVKHPFIFRTFIVQFFKPNWHPRSIFEWP